MRSSVFSTYLFSTALSGIVVTSLLIPEKFGRFPHSLPPASFLPLLKPMEVHFTPDVEKKLHDLAAQSGRGTDELLQDAVTAYFRELVQTREMLDGRYDELKNGQVQPVDGEEAFARLKAKTAEQRNHMA
jgi:hypothetical protein